MSATAGNILVNQGTGYKPSTANMTVKPGDRVLINARSSGELRFADGCKIQLLPGVVTIAKQSPCRVKAQTNQDLGGPGYIGPALGFGAIGLIGGALWLAEENSDSTSP
ncbi:MAG: hypothetical protein KDJ29_19815 [Hyphomicrobiales bacterium]|nr:hypothetical protein [Hyphomicrobiales bacterium]